MENPDLPGLPTAPFTRWLKSELPELYDSGEWRAEVISGGLSNITYRLRFPGRNLILRRPPLGTLLPRAHDMKREYRALTALRGTDVPVPETLALCADPAVLGGAFYLMAEVRGEVIRSAEEAARLTESQRALLADDLVRNLARLHAVDQDAVGLGDYGRTDGYCARQVRRWGEQWRRSRTRELDDMDTLLARLADQVPAASDGTIVHGDYRLDNTITAPGDPSRIVAILDWELSTLGDPLADLGMLLTYWHDRGDAGRARIPVALGVTDHQGFPTSAQVADKYAALTGRNLDDLPFYRAFSAMKLAVILEGVHARYLGGQTLSEGYEGAGDAVPHLVSRALTHLAGHRPDTQPTGR